MADKVLCKYYMNGCCKSGDSCHFSHDFKDAPNMVCKFFLNGNCSYGNKCRYDHVRPDWANNSNKDKNDSTKISMTNNNSNETTTMTTKQINQEKQMQLKHERGHSVPNLPHHSNGNTWADVVGNHQSLPHSAAAVAPQSTSSPILYPQYSIGSNGTGYHHVYPGTTTNVSMMPYQMYHPTMVSGYTYYPSYYYPYQPMHPQSISSMSTPSTPLTYYTHPQNYYNTSHTDYSNEEYDNQQQYYEDDEIREEGDEGEETNTKEVEAEAEVDDEFNLWKKPSSGLKTRHHRHSSEPPTTSQTTYHHYQQKCICYQYMMHGICQYGNYCNMIHGNLCEICEKYCLVPDDKVQQEHHKKECKMRKEKYERRERSAELECAICLEKVYSKPNLNDRRFGLMECEHVFCITCIRNWRANDDGTADIETAVRTCPMCRKATHFIVPSPYWPESEEEKKQIMSAYKERLSKIDCKYFNFGDGNCPFGTSCLYRHVYKDGTKEDKVVRRATNADGQVTTIVPMKIVELLETATTKRASRRKR